MKSCPYCAGAIDATLAVCPQCHRHLPVSSVMTIASSTRIVAIDIPFVEIVVFMLKWTLATIPTFFLLGFIAAVTYRLLAMIMALLGMVLPY